MSESNEPYLKQSASGRILKLQSEHSAENCEAKVKMLL